ncbi:phage coat protein [Photobacterium damselae]|uniref:phage coat protein n=1 Tax=Photobacterium damselae TaxID=38293 RepID=UPI000D05A125|nr:phage coat protein [Photobacterium damselae]MBA5684104.1 phage coat protein [Photobacterium damselae subsp. damselae]MBA5684113.1 phage coat protein [Photobacterium damselae subsp. damselae]PSB77997.1 phage coat protein [Photobacterium damselae subsp. damselae]
MSTAKKVLVKIGSGAALLTMGAPVFAAEGGDAISSAITGALSGLSSVNGIIAAVAPIGIAIAIGMKVYTKGKSAVNKA